MTIQTPAPSWQELFDMGLYAAEAARIQGMSIDTAIKWARRNGLRWPDGRHHRFQAHRNSYCPCTVRGEEYPSISHAARALGLNESTIIAHLNRYGHADKAGLRGIGRNPAKGSRYKPVSIGGVDYPSIHAAAADLHLGKETIRAHRAGTLDQRGHDRVLAAVLRRDARKAKERMKENSA